jgi:hypothetical protein
MIDRTGPSDPPANGSHSAYWTGEARFSAARDRIVEATAAGAFSTHGADGRLFRSMIAAERAERAENRELCLRTLQTSLDYVTTRKRGSGLSGRAGAHAKQRAHFHMDATSERLAAAIEEAIRGLIFHFGGTGQG